MNKEELRNMIKGSYNDLTNAYKNTADMSIRNNILSLPEYQAADTVFCFVGTEDEIDTSNLIDSMIMDGKTVCVPLCTANGIMQAKRIESRDELSEGKYGIMEPDAGAPTIDVNDIGFAVIPCLTCNKIGQRLGHGGGYYDRFFAHVSVPAAIICREETMTAAIPTEQTDVRFDIVVSERHIYRN